MSDQKKRQKMCLPYRNQRIQYRIEKQQHRHPRKQPPQRILRVIRLINKQTVQLLLLCLHIDRQRSQFSFRKTRQRLQLWIFICNTGKRNGIHIFFPGLYADMKRNTLRAIFHQCIARQLPRRHDRAIRILQGDKHAPGRPVRINRHIDQLQYSILCIEFL